MKRQLEPYIERQEAEKKLTEVTGGLKRWEKHKNTDSREIERYRLQDFRLAQITLEELHYHLEPLFKISLTTGEDEVEASSFRKNSYDFYQEEPVPLAPRSEVPFDRIEVMHFEDRRNPTFYIGSYAVMLSLPTLASVINSGGSFSLLAAERPVDASSSAI